MLLKLWQFLTLAVIAFLLTSVEGQECPPENIDYEATRDVNIVSTDMVAEKTGMNELTDDMVKEKLESMQKDVSDQVEAHTSMAKSMSDDIDQQETKDLLKPYYYERTCPYRHFWLTYYRYSFYHDSQYCWTFYNYWITSCTYRPCKIKYEVQWYSYYYYQCRNEMRPVIFPVVCWYKNKEQKWQFSTSIKYIVRYLPQGCCCRRYNKFIKTDQCLAREP